MAEGASVCVRVSRGVFVLIPLENISALRTKSFCPLESERSIVAGSAVIVQGKKQVPMRDTLVQAEHCWLKAPGPVMTCAGRRVVCAAEEGA